MSFVGEAAYSAMAHPTIRQSRYLVEGLNCSSRAVRIEATLRRLPGVLEVSTSCVSGTISVRHVEDEFVSIAIERQVRSLGHKVVPMD